MKKFLNIVLSLILVFSFNVPTFAKTKVVTVVKYPNIPYGDGSYAYTYGDPDSPSSNVNINKTFYIGKNTDRIIINIPVKAKVCSNKKVNIVGFQIYKGTRSYSSHILRNNVKISKRKVFKTLTTVSPAAFSVTPNEAWLSGNIEVTLSNLKNFTKNNINNSNHTLTLKYIVRPAYRYDGSSKYHFPSSTYSVTTKIVLSNKKITSIRPSFSETKIKSNQKKQLTLNVTPSDSAEYVVIRNSKPAAFQVKYKNTVIKNNKSCKVRVCDLRNLKITAKTLGKKYSSRTGYIYIYKGRNFSQIAKKIKITVSKK